MAMYPDIRIVGAMGMGHMHTSPTGFIPGGLATGFDLSGRLMSSMSLGRSDSIISFSSGESISSSYSPPQPSPDLGPVPTHPGLILRTLPPHYPLHTFAVAPSSNTHAFILGRPSSSADTAAALEVGEEGVYVSSRVVSRRHAKIEFKDNEVYISDLGSTHGSLILHEGRADRFLQPHVAVQLQDKDEIRIGKRIDDGSSGRAVHFRVEFMPQQKDNSEGRGPKEALQEATHDQNGRTTPADPPLDHRYSPHPIVMPRRRSSGTYGFFDDDIEQDVPLPAPSALVSPSPSSPGPTPNSEEYISSFPCGQPMRYINSPSFSVYQSPSHDYDVDGPNIVDGQETRSPSAAELIESVVSCPLFRSDEDAGPVLNESNTRQDRSGAPSSYRPPTELPSRVPTSQASRQPSEQLPYVSDDGDSEMDYESDAVVKRESESAPMLADDDAMRDSSSDARIYPGRFERLALDVAHIQANLRDSTFAFDARLVELSARVASMSTSAGEYDTIAKGSNLLALKQEAAAAAADEVKQFVQGLREDVQRIRDNTVREIQEEYNKSKQQRKRLLKQMKAEAREGLIHRDPSSSIKRKRGDISENGDPLPTDGLVSIQPPHEETSLSVDAPDSNFGEADRTVDASLFEHAASRASSVQEGNDDSANAIMPTSHIGQPPAQEDIAMDVDDVAHESMAAPLLDRLSSPKRRRISVEASPNFALGSRVLTFAAGGVATYLALSFMPDIP